MADCNDQCPSDKGKTLTGICGCGIADTDTDNDDTPDCNDNSVGYDSSGDRANLVHNSILSFWLWSFYFGGFQGQAVPSFQLFGRINAMLECFLIGSEAIQMLVMDPLLPESMIDSSIRVRLTRMMLDYDNIGKRLWSEQSDQVQIDQSPTNIQLVEKAI